jgi:diacylglycerol kinase family enzyme
MIGARQEGDVIKAVYFDRVPFTTCGVKANKYKIKKTDGFQCNPRQACLMVDEIRRQCCWWGRDQPPSCALVVNPCSGKGRALNMVHETLLPVLRDAAGWRVDLFTSESPSLPHQLDSRDGGALMSVTEATRLITAPASSSPLSLIGNKVGGRFGSHHVDLVAFVGGDGTVFEGLQGLMDSFHKSHKSGSPQHRPTPFVHVPGGSGNGLAASCGLWDVETAAVAMILGKTRSLDLASVLQPKSTGSDQIEQGMGGTRFYSFLSTVFGLLANLDIGTEHLRWMGEARYTHKVIQEALYLKPYPCRVAYLPSDHSSSSPSPCSQGAGQHVAGFPPGLPLPFLSQHQSLSTATTIHPPSLPPNWRILPQSDFNFLALYNVPFMATHARLNPKGSLNDGSMDLIWAQGLTGLSGRLQLLSMMIQSEEGGHVDMEFVKSEKVKAFVIEPLFDDTWLVVDGEVIERKTTWIETHPSACDVIISDS